jgi:hypothetical protein
MLLSINVFYNALGDDVDAVTFDAVAQVDTNVNSRVALKIVWFWPGPTCQDS